MAYCPKEFERDALNTFETFTRMYELISALAPNFTEFY